MRVALTGTPGTGKTTLAAVAGRDGWRVVDVRSWAASVGAVAGHDPLDAADAIDLARLRRALPKDDGSRVLYEGHLSHLLAVDGVWVARCDPRVLRPRLETRGYPPPKVAENLEAEALDLILQEALGRHARVVQRDGTHRTPEALYAAFHACDLAGLAAPDLEPVDWSDQLPIQASPATRGES